MIRKTIIPVFLVVTVLVGCGKGSSKADSEVVERKDTLNLSGTSAEADTGKHFVALKAADATITAKIKKVLPVIFEKELKGADSTARRFIYDTWDLNGDGKNELFVGFTGMNWCGSGGCTALLLTPEGVPITKFTVVDFPFFILDQKTGGWKDLVVYSGGSQRRLRWDGKKYPSNPSVAPKLGRKLQSEDSTKVLSVAGKSNPWIAF